MVSIILAISLFNESIISFGYVLIVMLILFDVISIHQRTDKSQRLAAKLKWILLPYLLIDLFIQLIIHVPGTVLVSHT